MPPKGRIGGVFIEILGGVSSGISARYTFLSLIEIGRYTIRFLPLVNIQPGPEQLCQNRSPATPYYSSIPARFEQIPQGLGIGLARVSRSIRRNTWCGR